MSLNVKTFLINKGSRRLRRKRYF